MTFKCRVCGVHYTPTAPRRYPGFPGYCDECGWLEEETRPPSDLERKITDLKIGGSLFFPVTTQDPRPWETLKAEIKRVRWAFLSGGLCVHPVQRGDTYIDTRDGHLDYESEDGARLFKTLTPEQLNLGWEFVKQVTAYQKGRVNQG
jgi:hypothetical protein